MPEPEVESPGPPGSSYVCLQLVDQYHHRIALLVYSAELG